MKSPFALPVVRETLSARPLHVLDVGAAGGVQWHWMRYGAESFCRYYGFEPTPENFEKLKPGPTTRFFPFAISDAPGRTRFYALGTGGSIEERIDREKGYGDRYRQIEVQVESIEHLVQSGVIGGCDVIKSDAERHDIHVFAGAGPLLSSDVLCAISEFHYYREGGEGDFSDLHRLLTDAGLMLFSISHKNGAAGELQGGDFMYFREVGTIVSSAHSAERKAEMIVKLFVCCVLMGFLKYAYIVVRTAEEEKLIDATASAALLQYLSRHYFAPRALGGGSGQLKLSHALSFAAHLLAGRKWGAKSAPRSNGLQNYSRLYVDSALVPARLRERDARDLEEYYRQYRRLGGIYYAAEAPKRALAGAET